LVNSNLIEQLYNDIENSFEMKKDSYWNSIVEEIKREKDKNPNEEYVSIKKAIKIYLGESNDYNNEFFTRMCEIQDELESSYDKLVSRFIKDNSELSDTRVEKMLKNLKIHYDLYSEIVECFLAGNIYKKKLIEVEGYDVKELCSKYNLSIVGAYNYLIYLREEPKKALADLNKEFMKKAIKKIEKDRRK